MNPDQIIAKWESMSSRKRNAWVAEVIFGWKAVRIKDAEYAYELGVCCVETIPHYTEDISAAWTLMETASFSVDINTTPSSTRVNFHRNGWSQYDVWRPTAPDAICLAAMVAKLTTEVQS